MHICIAKNGTKTGPYSEEQVRGMLTGGLVSVDDSAWHEGAADWQPLHILLGLKQPPPIPTAAPPIVAQPKQIIGQPTQLLTRMPIPVQDTPAASSNHPSSHSTNPTEPKQTWSEIIDRLQPDSPFVKTQPKQATSSQATAPVKVGGWLLFFCVGLTLAPLWVFSQLPASWKEAKPTFASFPAIETSMIWCIFSSVALRSYGFIVGIMIWAGNTRGREIAKRFLIVRVVGDIGSVVIALLIIKDLPSSIFYETATAAFGGMLQGFIYCIVWWFYFKKSKRVRDTYGPENAQFTRNEYHAMNNQATPPPSPTNGLGSPKRKQIFSYIGAGVGLLTHKMIMLSWPELNMSLGAIAAGLSAAASVYVGWSLGEAIDSSMTGK